MEYGVCLPKKSQKKEKIELEDGEYLVFSQKQLTDIINPRISEIFDEIHKDLKKISRDKNLPSGIVLAGGGAKLPGIVDLARKELKLPSRLGSPQGISNLRDLSFGTCCGLVLSGADLEERGEKVFGPMRSWGSKIKKLFRIFLP